MQFLCRVVWKGLCFLLNSAYYWYIALIAGKENPPLIKLWVLCKTNLTTQDLCTFPFYLRLKINDRNPVWHPRKPTKLKQRVWETVTMINSRFSN